MHHVLSRVQSSWALLPTVIRAREVLFHILSTSNAYKFMRTPGFPILACPPFSLTMPTHPPSFQPSNGPHHGPDHLPSPLPALRAPPRDVQLEGDCAPLQDIHSHDKPKPFPLVINHPPTTGPNTLINLAGRLRLSLPPSCPWFGPEDLRVIGTRPVDAGGFADLWVGEMDDRKVAVKSYRCYSSASCTPTYKVGHPQPFFT